MKLNVSPNPGWVHKTVGKLDTWQDLANTGINATTGYSPAWEPSSATLGTINITFSWIGATTGTIDLDLYGTYDGTNYVWLANVGTQIANATATNTQTNAVDLSSYPAGKYKLAMVNSGDNSGDTFEIFITEQ